MATRCTIPSACTPEGGLANQRSRPCRLDSEQRLHLIALLPHLLELALEAALRKQARPAADAHAIALPLHVADRDERERGAVFALDAERRAERAALHAAIRFAQPALAGGRARRNAERSGGMKTAHHFGERHLLVAAALREKNRRDEMRDGRQPQESQRTDFDVAERREATNDVVDDEPVLAPFFRIRQQLLGARNHGCPRERHRAIRARFRPEQ